MTHVFDVDTLVDDRDVEIVLCCGAGGVGKTTTSAALALRAAERGRKVVVLTIDPARRLAQSLGLTQLDNTPRPVEGIEGTGRLDAVMLDMKRTFDDVVTGHASPAVAQQILDNPFYEALSTSFSGTQEYMAMEKLGQLHAQARRDGRWDLIIVDTPPSRSALDFLDAPEHLATLLDGRMLRMLLAPARGPMKLMSVGVNVVMGAMGKILGAQVLTDVQAFVSAFDTLFGGFRTRAEATLATLSSPHTRFVVVAAPQVSPLREAGFFVDRLAEESLPLAGVVINRVHHSPAALDAETAETRLAGLPQCDEVGVRAARVALETHAWQVRQVEQERRQITGFTASRSGMAVAEVPALDGDVSDLASLRAVGLRLAHQE
ncbi:ArsA family ATPase [Mariniluteicoccus endophyticus]